MEPFAKKKCIAPLIHKTKLSFLISKLALPVQCTINKSISCIISLHTAAQLQTVIHLALQKGVCCGRAAFDDTFQNETTFPTVFLRAKQTWIEA